MVFGIGIIAAFAAFARTAAPVVNLEWSAPAGCPDREVVLKEVARLLGGSVPDQPLSVRVDASQRTDGGWSMHLITPVGERHFDGDSCDRLADAAAVVIALIIVPTPTPTPGQATTTPPAGAVAATPPAATSPRALKILVRPEVSVLGGPLPSASPGAGLAAGVLVGRLRLEANGFWGGPSQQVTLPDGAGASLSMVFLAGLSGCWTALSQRVELDACLGVESGILNGSGTGVDHPSQGQTWWVGLHGGGAVAYPVTNWMLVRLDISLGYSPTQPSFVIEGTRQVAKVAAWNAGGGLGAEARF